MGFKGFWMVVIVKPQSTRAMGLRSSSVTSRTGIRGRVLEFVRFSGD